MQWFILKLASPDVVTVEYALLSKQKSVDEFTPTGWPEVKQMSQGKRVILLIPTEEVILSQIAIPATSQKLLAKAVPFAFEENIAEDIESLHFVYYRESAGKAVNVTAINANRLQEWVDALLQHEIVPHIVLPDVFALPVQPGTAALSIRQQRALVRKDALTGFSGDSVLLPALLSAELENTNIDPPIETLLLETPVDLPLRLSDQITVKAAGNMSRQCHASLLQAFPLNLLNRFQHNGEPGWVNSLLKWKTAAMLLALTGVLWVAIAGLKNHGLKQRVKQLDTAIASVYSEVFPNTKVDDDYGVLHSIMNEKLKPLLNTGQAPTVSSPLELLAKITPTIKKHSRSVTLSKVRFDNTVLQLAITATSLAQLEQFKKAIGAGGVKAELVSTTSSANKVESTLRVSKGKPK